MADFYTLLTSTGRAKLANAQVSGVPVSLTHMAVGDGDPATPGGAYYNPTEAQTTLKHETWRGAINNLYVDPQNPSWIVAELVIPDTEGGFYIREVGLFDTAGALIAIGKFPESYKPTLPSGSNKQLYVRMILEVSNTSAVTLMVDPSVVLATRQYVDQKVIDEINKLDGKQSVRVATTAAIALTGLQTIDGVQLVAGNRVLVKNQVAAKENGVYVVAAGGWTRALDVDSSIETTPGLFVAVEQGGVNADSIWQLVTDAPITLGVSDLAWEMVAGKSGVSTGTYNSVSVDARGRVVAGTNQPYMTPAAADLAGYAKKNATQTFTRAQVGAEAPLPATTGMVTLDLATANNHGGTLTGAIILANPSNIQPGQSGVIRLQQPAAATAPIAYGSVWKPADGTSLPALTALAGATDDLVYYVETATRIVVGRVGGSA